MTTVVHHVLDPDGMPLQGRTVTITLMLRLDVAPDSYDLNAPDPFQGNPISRYALSTSDSTGLLSWDLVPNDQIVPSGSYYEVHGLGASHRTFLYVPDSAAVMEMSECVLTLVDLGSSNLVLVQGPRGRQGGDASGGTGVPVATMTQKGIIQLSGDLGGTAAAPTVPGLTGKANSVHTHVAADISDASTTGRAVLKATDPAAARTALGAGTSSLVLGTTSSTAKAGDYAPPDAATNTKGLIALAGDLGGTPALPTVPGLATKSNVGHTHSVADMTATGTRDATKYLRGDNVWAVPPTGAVAAASPTNQGIIQLSGDLGGTASAPTVVSGVNHGHTAAQVSDASTVGRAVLTAATAAAARTTLGAGNVTGTGVSAIVVLTQAAYTALATKDPATLYVIQG